MTIKKRLLLNTIITITLSLIYILLMVVSNFSNTKALQRKKIADNMIIEIMALMNLTTEWNSYKYERIGTQWLDKYSVITSLVESYPDVFPDSKEKLKNLITSFELMQRIVSNINEGQLGANSAQIIKKEKMALTRLSANMHINSYNILTQASVMSQKSLNNLMVRQNRNRLVLLLLSIILILFIISTNFNLYKIVTNAFQKQLSGINKLKKGDLKFRFNLKDSDQKGFQEFTAIKGAFNDMIEKLVNSLLELEIEVVKRKKYQEILSESEEKFRNIFENSPLAMSMKDIDDKWQANNTFCNMLGYSKFQLESMEWSSIIHPDDVIADNDIMESLLNNKIHKGIFKKRYIHSNGDVVFTDSNIILQRDLQDNALYFIITAIDITKQKEDQEELDNYRNKLLSMVQERTSELEEKRKNYQDSQVALSYLMEDVNEMRDELTYLNQKLFSANKELESFSYSVSHDLRAPLRAIDGFSKMLEIEYYEKLDNEAKEYINVVRSNTKVMGNLINDLLEFSRFSRANIKRNTFNMKLEFQSVFEDILRSTNNDKAELILPDLVEIEADHKMIRQVLYNLLSNAIKYSSKREKSIVEVSMQDREIDYVFTVKDNGVGFDMKYVHKLFGVFQRLHTPEEFEGTGVGLAIVNRIILKHGGTVWAESVLGEGANFSFSIPKDYRKKVEEMSQEEVNKMAEELLKQEAEFSMNSEVDND